MPPVQEVGEETVVSWKLGERSWLQAAVRCITGKVRTRNEDSCFAFTSDSGGEQRQIPFGLYIVADGMGGHHAGHEASRQVSNTLARNVLQRIYLPLLHGEGQAGSSTEPVSEVMLDAVQAANQQIHSPEPGLDSGTTVTAALLFGRRLYLAHVGDSRAYLYEGSQLRQLTTDHSYVQRLQESGKISAEEASAHPQRNVLYKAVGQGAHLEVDTYTQVLGKAGLLLLCSDGLWGMVGDEPVMDVLGRQSPLQDRADALVALALEAGGHDNITAILVDYHFE
jgi:protein phosphatase